IKPDSFSVYIIPHTAKMTTIGMRKAGDRVNIETDVLGKYIGRHSDGDGKEKASRITPEFLEEKGFV
ncbi:MAG: riboflavin synthase, partial [Candidatus Omnitrophota bacterium]